MSQISITQWDDPYLAELRYLCKCTECAYGELIERTNLESTNNLLLQVFVHSFLVFGGNAHKILFPSPKGENTKKALKRAEHLRLKLGIKKSLDNLKFARDYCEHFDERIDKFVYGPTPARSAVMVRALDKIHQELDINGCKYPVKYLIGFDTKTFDVVLHDRKINLSSIILEITNLKNKVEKILVCSGVDPSRIAMTSVKIIV